MDRVTNAVMDRQRHISRLDSLIGWNKRLSERSAYELGGEVFVLNFFDIFYTFFSLGIIPRYAATVIPDLSWEGNPFLQWCILEYGLITAMGIKFIAVSTLLFAVLYRHSILGNKLEATKFALWEVSFKRFLLGLQILYLLIVARWVGIILAICALEGAYTLAPEFYFRSALLRLFADTLTFSFIPLN